jgi:hypothetical protein
MMGVDEEWGRKLSRESVAQDSEHGMQQRGPTGIRHNLGHSAGKSAGAVAHMSYEL